MHAFNSTALFLWISVSRGKQAAQECTERKSLCIVLPPFLAAVCSMNEYLCEAHCRIISLISLRRKEEEDDYRSVSVPYLRLLEDCCQTLPSDTWKSSRRWPFLPIVSSFLLLSSPCCVTDHCYSKDRMYVREEAIPETVNKRILVSKCF